MIKNFITVTGITDNSDDILKGRKEPHIRYYLDVVRVWNGKREEIELATEEEQARLENLIDNIVKERNECNMLNSN